MVRDYWMMSVCFIIMQASTPEFRKWVCYKNLEHFMQHAIFLLVNNKCSRTDMTHNFFWVTVRDLLRERMIAPKCNIHKRTQ